MAQAELAVAQQLLHLGLQFGGKATYARAVLGGAVLGPPVGGLTAASTSIVLLISSSNVEWARQMAVRALASGAMMGLVNGIAAALVIVYFIRRWESRPTPAGAS